jgi:Transposase
MLACPHERGSAPVLAGSGGSVPTRMEGTREVSLWRPYAPAFTTPAPPSMRPRSMDPSVEHARLVVDRGASADFWCMPRGPRQSPLGGQRDPCGTVTRITPAALAISAGRVKTDAVDARTLAHLLRADLLPEAYIASRELRDLRDLLRHRVALTRMRSAL